MEVKIHVPVSCLFSVHSARDFFPCSDTDFLHKNLKSEWVGKYFFIINFPYGDLGLRHLDGVKGFQDMICVCFCFQDTYVVLSFEYSTDFGKA